MSTYRLHAIFSSLQGEGRNVGRPATFVRFATCNLKCPWCDTHKTERMTVSATEILRAVERNGSKSVIITGGEPTIQPGLSELVKTLKSAGCWVALETNGVLAPQTPELFDYISVSPKSEYFARYQEDKMIHAANEVRIVAVTDEIVTFCRNMRERIKATDYYISPLDLLVKVNKLTPELPPWSLSIQMHKVIGIR